MRTLCLKTEYPEKHLSGWLFNEDWTIERTEKGTGLDNLKTKEKCFILGLTSTNSSVFELSEPIPLDWEPRAYYYYPNTNSWERIPQEPIINEELNNEDTAEQNNGDSII